MQYITGQTPFPDRPIWIFSKEEYESKITDIDSLIDNLRGHFVCKLPNINHVAEMRQSAALGKCPIPFLIDGSETGASVLSFRMLASYKIDKFLYSPESLFNKNVTDTTKWAVCFDRQEVQCSLKRMEIEYTQIKTSSNKPSFKVLGNWSGTALVIKNTDSTLRANLNLPTGTYVAGHDISNIPTGRLISIVSSNTVGANSRPAGRDMLLPVGYKIEPTPAAVQPLLSQYLQDGIRSTYWQPRVSVLTMQEDNGTLVRDFPRGDTSKLVAYQTDGTQFRKFLNGINLKPVTKEDGSDSYRITHTSEIKVLDSKQLEI